MSRNSIGSNITSSPPSVDGGAPNGRDELSVLEGSNATGRERLLGISVGANRYSKDWKNETVRWSDLLTRLATPTVTSETHAEFMALPVVRQADIKDIGGFVGGTLRGGRRKSEYVQTRSMITLDADNDPSSLLTDLDIITDYAWCVYSTHKHTAAHPRLRLIIPTDRDMTAEEYEAVARMIASDFGIDIFDPTCFRPAQLMYWPSKSSDGEYVFETGEGSFLSVDKTLGRYPDWRDISFWPQTLSEQKTARGEGARGRHQKDPLAKPGIVGAYCRAHSMTDILSGELSDVYEPTESDDRYTYKRGSTSGGLVVYDDRFAYSNHATDPASGLLCNAFDLVRIHRFGDLDEDDPGKSGTALPSYKAMTDFALADPETKKLLISERVKPSAVDYEDKEDREDNEDNATGGDGENSEEGAGVSDDSWQGQLEIDRQGNVKGTVRNLLLIAAHDTNLRGIVFNELADNLEFAGEGVPWNPPGSIWRTQDDDQVYCYINETYGNFSKANIGSVITKVADDRRYHPIKDYFNSLPAWDKTPRAETLLIDYLGADDTPYVRAVTRKTLCAAVMRIASPGCKFDYILTLVGPQGIGKSSLVASLGMDWFTDSLSLSDTRDKTGAEKLQGSWIVEIGELAGMRKTDIETIKAFISRQDDKYRSAFAKRATSHPRQSIFFATTNAEDGFLRDITGGRRFWPVYLHNTTKSPGPDQDTVDQIWAEVLTMAEREPLYLTEDEEKEAVRLQKESVEHDPREGTIREYLGKLLPENWNALSVWERRDWLEDANSQRTNPGITERDYVCLQEIWSEALGLDVARMARKDSYDLSAILERIEGWECVRGSTRRFGFYGPQKYWRKV